MDFLELLLMNTSKNATCEKGPVGVEEATCCASRLSDPEQRRGLGAAVAVAGVGVVAGACDRCSCLSPPKKGCASARHWQARVKHAPCPRTIGPMNETHQQSRIIFKAQQPGLSEYFGRQLLKPIERVKYSPSVHEDAGARELRSAAQGLHNEHHDASAL